MSQSPSRDKNSWNQEKARLGFTNKTCFTTTEWINTEISPNIWWSNLGLHLGRPFVVVWSLRVGFWQMKIENPFCKKSFWKSDLISNISCYCSLRGVTWKINEASGKFHIGSHGDMSSCWHEFHVGSPCKGPLNKTRHNGTKVKKKCWGTAPMKLSVLA